MGWNISRAGCIYPDFRVYCAISEAVIEVCKKRPWGAVLSVLGDIIVELME
jgi:hypothetical protein